MPKEVRIWRIETGDKLREVPSKSLDLESRLEVWLEQDISVLSDDLVVIARQLPTDFGGFIDLLCLDRNGDVVVVELKRDKTPREVTAQALDYASWVRDLSNEAVTRIAEAYLGSRRSVDLGKAFQDRFGEDLPEVLNDGHSLLIVASSIDPSSERIIRYLSDMHGVKINAATFHYFMDSDGTEHLARAFLLEPEAVEHRSAQRGSAKRRAPPSFDDYEEIAESNGVGDTYRLLLGGVQPLLHPATMVTLVAFYGKIDGSDRAIFSLYPADSSVEKGLHFTVYLWRLARLLGLEPEEVRQALPGKPEPWKYVSTSDQDGSGYSGYFKTQEGASAFMRLFS